MSYNSLLPLLKKTKSPLTVEKFQERINIVFHNHEATHYDKMHLDMWQSLEEQIQLLINDLFLNINVKNSLKLLDIGCGTGLSTQLLLQSKIKSHISHITLLDTSEIMLKQANLKAKHWGKEYKIVNGYLSDVSEKFDIVIISSVLHHIPDLELFLKQVDSVLNKDGILIHLQDPNGDFLHDLEFLERVNEFENLKNKMPKQRSLKDIVPKNIKQLLNRFLGRKTYIDLINDNLIAEKTIKYRMTADELWSVTDIHVETKKNTESKGISLFFLKNQLVNFNLINHRSYGFYGVLKSELFNEFLEKENELIQNNVHNGRNLSGIWVKK
jgi:ubiquinone/menaquinone biosynthesis C-methylase UbiE